MDENLTLQVNLDLNAGPVVQDAMAEWFRGCFLHLGGELRERILARAPLPDAPVRGGVSKGKAGDPWAHFSVSHTKNGKTRRRMSAFTEESYRKFLDGFSAVPDNALFLSATIDDWGDTASPFLRIKMTRHDHDTDWVFLTAEFSPDLLTDTATEDRLVTWLQDFAGTYPLTYGGLDGQYELFRTRHERAKGLIPDIAVQESATKLRGVSWFTICTSQVVESLGGEDRLRASGVFAEVRKLASESYWLQANGRLSEFDDAGFERVTRVVEPALVTRPEVYPDAAVPQRRGRPGSRSKPARSGPHTVRRFVRWQADDTWYVMDPATGVMSRGPSVEKLVEHTRMIASLNSGTDIAAADVEMGDLPDCRDEVRRARAAFESGDKDAGGVAMNKAAGIVRAAGWGEEEARAIVKELFMQ